MLLKGAGQSVYSIHLYNLGPSHVLLPFFLGLAQGTSKLMRAGWSSDRSEDPQYLGEMELTASMVERTRRQQVQSS